MADYDFGGYGGFPRYVSVGERRAKALLQARKLEKRGRVLEPVRLEGQRIASSFWARSGARTSSHTWTSATGFPAAARTCAAGQWSICGSAPGRSTRSWPEVRSTRCRCGSTKLARKRWGAVIKRCAGRIDSVVGLLQGRLSETVLEALVDRRAGLFPAPKEIDFTCSCPTSHLLWQARRRGALRSRRAARQEARAVLHAAPRGLEELVAEAHSAAHRGRRRPSTRVPWREFSGSNWIGGRAAAGGKGDPVRCMDLLTGLYYDH